MKRFGILLLTTILRSEALICTSLLPRIKTTVIVRRSTEDDSSVFLRRQEFDVLSFRSWRRETLFKYSNANQSEPLRIVLFLLITISLIFAPAIADAIGAPAPEPIAGYWIGGAGSLALLARERDNRTRKLLRLEREGIVADLNLSLVKNVLVGGQQTISVRSLRNEKRLIAVCGVAKDLEKLEMLEFAPLQRRLEAARTIVVPIPTDQSMRRYGTSYAQASDLEEWRRVFQTLLTADQAWGSNFQFDQQNKAAFFVLGLNGRSVASGQGFPRLLELLGSRLPPIDPIQPQPQNIEFAPQAAFYSALKSGNIESMNALFGREDDAEVSAIIANGGRLDPWTSQLGPQSRPSELIIGDADLTIFDDVAITTAIEQNGLDPFQTLLATQRWTRVGEGEDDWRLFSHATVPFTPSAMAAALLRCDHRGCVLLVNQQQITR